jgi:nucleotide-binding universal stress UspA family protein
VRDLEQIAVGFNVHARHGPLLEALRIASEAQCHLDVLYVTSEGEAPATLSDTVEKAVRGHLDGDGPDFSVHILTGKIPVALAKFCACGNADLLIVGPRKKTLRERFLGGGAAAQLARFIDVPVLIAADRSAGPFRKVLVPVDFSPPSTQALETAIEWVEGTNDAEIHIVHVFGRIGSSLRLDQGAHVGRLLTIATEELQHQVDSLDFRGVRHEVRILAGRTHKAILKYADEIDADLIIAGSVGSNWLGEAIIGATTAKLVKAPRRPTLIVHPLGRGD